MTSPQTSAGTPESRDLGFASRAVHAGERGPRPDFTPTATPIYPATAFVYDDTDTLDAVFGNERQGYVYTRYANPTTSALESAIASLEGTEDAVAFASGMGAVYAAMLLDVRAGQRIVAAPDVYGATYAILNRLLPSLGIETIFVDLLDLDALEQALCSSRPALVYAETISNPLLRVADLREVTALAHRHDARVAVDNTFATPWLVNPAALGVDSVIHSTTKYLGGHGDVTGGVIATTAERAAALREINKLIGSVAGTIRVLVDAARAEDAAAPDEAAERQRSGRRHMARERLPRLTCELPGTAGSRRRGVDVQPDRARRHDLVRGPRRRARRYLSLL